MAMAELNVEESGDTRWKGAMPVETLLFLNGIDAKEQRHILNDATFHQSIGSTGLRAS